MAAAHYRALDKLVDAETRCESITNDEAAGASI
jgi:hypothetical protein